jgi:ApaG protein
MNRVSAQTEEIVVSVQPLFLNGQSSPITRKFVFAYFIRIENHGQQQVQVLRRHWYITDSSGDVEEVEGEGIIGQQPVIEPGKVHEYNSFCVLKTFEGTMEGTYLVRRKNGETFRAIIPKFILRALTN